MPARTTIHRTVVGSLCVGALAVGLCALAVSPAQAAAAGVTVTLRQGVLTITGNSVANSLSVGKTAANVITLNGAVVLGGAATTANVAKIVMDGGAGNDTLRLDETRGTMPPIDFRGGAGNDQLLGGTGPDTLSGGPGADALVGNGGADTLIGGAGNDKAIGGPGDDTVALGNDSDQFTWNLGDGNDHVDGDAGKDTLILNGFDRAPSAPLETEDLEFDSDGTRTTAFHAFTRQLPSPSETDKTSFSGFELVKSALGGGPNSVAFGAGMVGSDIAVIRVDLGPPGSAPIDPRQGVDTRSRASFIGTDGPDRIRITGSPAAGADVTGHGPTVLLTRAQILTVLGQGGDDVIDAGLLVAGTVESLQEIGTELATDGNDTLIGHPGSDVLFGGAGNDRLEGRGGGHDSLDGGSGNDVVIA